MRVFACELAADSVDENLRIAESTVLVCLDIFCIAVTAGFG